MLIVYEISVQVVFMFSGSKCKEKLLASFFFSLYEYPNLQKGTTIDFFNCNYYNYSTRRYPYEKNRLVYGYCLYDVHSAGMCE